MGDVILFKEDVDQLNSLLKNLVDDAKILSALLVTKDTRVLACQGTLASTDTGALAALLVGSFASTQAIAGLIGETEFDTLTHCGKSRNVVISLIDSETILASVFDKSSSIDRIHASVIKHLDVLKKALRSISGNTTHDLFDTGSSAGSSDAGDEFEIRADALRKSAEPDQADSVEIAPAISPAAANKSEREASEPAQPHRPERGPKTPPAHGQGAGAPNEIKRPPDTDMAIISQVQPAAHTEETGRHAHAPNAAQAAVAPAAEPVARKAEAAADAKEYEELLVEGKPGRAAHPPAPSHEQQPREAGASAEAVHMSMNYLKNKTREGALYYHHDKAFFKKFFKSSHKKKS
jgi:predicted regulator of Ras-like GTPase activity (Roadblock/LC7/MglB family)